MGHFGPERTDAGGTGAASASRLAKNLECPDEVALRLASDEIGYEELAYALLQGVFPIACAGAGVPDVYRSGHTMALGERSPAKLLYVQAFVGVVAVPLTYLLARRLTGIIPALVAAGIVALDDSLIWHARGIYTEIVYTPLLLVALLALLWALQAPRPWRFAWAGAGMAVVTLCRPTTAFLPLLLPLVLPWGWTLKQKAGVCLAYGLTMVVVIAPWTYHNWRTLSPLPPVDRLGRSPLAWEPGVLSSDAASAGLPRYLG